MARADGSKLVVQTFTRLADEYAARQTRAWTVAERGVWQIVSARLQVEMGGVGTVFTDCSAVDLEALVTALGAIGEQELSDGWAQACEALERQGILRRGKWTGAELDDDVLDALDEVVADRMNALDDKLAAWLRR